MVGAFGRPWFMVHRERCLGLVQLGAQGAIVGALYGLKYVLQQKAPKALLVLEGTTKAVRQIRQERQFNG